MNKNKKYQLKKEDWDNQEACKKEAVRLGYTERIGYLAWTAGQGACGYECVLSFFDDIEEVVIETKKEVFDDFIKVLKEFSSFTTYDYVNDYRIKELERKHLENQKRTKENNKRRRIGNG